MNCNFVEKDGIWECSHCGFTFKRNVNRKCGPSAVKRVTNFTKSVVKHVFNGMEKSSQEEIDRRLSICNECPLFQDGICKHNECGCNVSNKQKFMNKLAWADQECPLGKWRI